MSELHRLFDRAAFLHDLACAGPASCECKVLYRVRTPVRLAYTPVAGVSGESDTVSRGASSVLTPLAARLRVHGSKP